MDKTQHHYHNSSPKPVLLHNMKRILVNYNNRKKHGAHPVYHKTCEGCISSRGEIVLFSEELPRKGYRSENDLKETLGEYGDVEIDYVDAGTQHELPTLSLLSKIVLRDVIQNSLLEHKVHDLIWHYATTAKYDKTDVEKELKALIKWLEASEA